jgi:hypothetical protein
MVRVDSGGVAAVAPVGAPVQTSLWPYTRTNVADARHTIDLERAAVYYWQLDAAQAGLGGDDRCVLASGTCVCVCVCVSVCTHLQDVRCSWSPRTHPEYQLLERNYALTFTLEPFTGAAPRPAQLRTLARALTSL